MRRHVANYVRKTSHASKDKRPFKIDKFSSVKCQHDREAKQPFDYNQKWSREKRMDVNQSRPKSKNVGQAFQSEDPLTESLYSACQFLIDASSASHYDIGVAEKSYAYVIWQRPRLSLPDLFGQMKRGKLNVFRQIIGGKPSSGKSGMRI
jgi:hypothetical protein